MKTAFVAAAFLLASVPTYAQGQINFANKVTSRIWYSFPDHPVEAGAYKVQLYFAPLGSPQSSLIPLTDPPVVTGPVPGRFLGGNRTIPPGDGKIVIVQVRVWPVAYESYEAASASGNPNACTGQSNIFEVDPSDGPLDPPGQLTGLSPFLVCYIPEPPAVALLLAGLGLLLARRFNKRPGVARLQGTSVQLTKRTLIALACALATPPVYAQGVINFANFNSSRISYGSGPKAGQFVEPGTFKVQLYFGPQGAAESSLIPLADAPALTGPVPGRFLGGNRDIPPGYGQVVTVQVRAWSAAYASYEAALASGRDDVRIGKSNVFDVRPETGMPPATALTGLEPFTVDIPEPSSAALLLAGLGLLLARRFNKRPGVARLQRTPVQLTKQTLIALACALAAPPTYAQGEINFANTDSQKITYFETGQPVEPGAFKLQLYWGPRGSTESALAPLSYEPALTGPVPGRFLGGNRKIPPGDGKIVTVQIRAWSVAYDTWEAALASGRGDVCVGKSNVFDADPSDTALGPPGLLTGLQPFTVGIPEPSSAALLLIGAGLLLARRLK